MKPARIWVSADEVLEVPAVRRAKWLKETLGLSTAQSEKLNEALEAASGKNASAQALEALSKFAVSGARKGHADPSLSKARPGQLVLQPGSERRRTSSHYTPRSLSAPIVRRTLEPLLAVTGEAPSSERILNLKVCDPAMGSGAFLVEACRYLADQVLVAWTREGCIDTIAAEHGEPLLHARRLVAQRCLYGVDKNDAAVELAKLSLWLVTLSKTLPFTFLDHSLRQGDSLVGLDFEQIRAFHWKRPEESTTKKAAPKQLELFGREIAVALEEAIALRQKIGELGDSPLEDKEKARLFWDAQDALDRVRLIGDVIVGAFFAHEKDKDREAERVRRESVVRAWLLSGSPPSEALLAMQRELRARLPVFHWMVEFPEVFYAERPDTLDENQVNRAAFMDAFVGNPPFAGKNGISEGNGLGYLPWLVTLHEKAHGNADLSAHFFRRTATLLGQHGTLGFIATNTIAQGDTRSTGLQYLVDHNAVIYDAIESMMWPGDAAVSVSVVHMALGSAVRPISRKRLNGAPVAQINSQLGAGAERSDARKLFANAGTAFVGSYVLGMGFTLTPEEREALVRKDPRNAERIFPYLGGQEVNTSPTQTFDRYVISFGTTSLEEAERWPDLLAIVRQKVKPERDKLKNNPDGRRQKTVLVAVWARYPRASGRHRTAQALLGELPSLEAPDLCLSNDRPRIRPHTLRLPAGALRLLRHPAIPHPREVGAPALVFDEERPALRRLRLLRDLPVPQARSARGAPCARRHRPAPRRVPCILHARGARRPDRHVQPAQRPRVRRRAHRRAPNAPRGHGPQGAPGLRRGRSRRTLARARGTAVLPPLRGRPSAPRALRGRRHRSPLRAERHTRRRRSPERPRPRARQRQHQKESRRKKACAQSRNRRSGPEESPKSYKKRSPVARMAPRDPRARRRLIGPPRCFVPASPDRAGQPPVCLARSPSGATVDAHGRDQEASVDPSYCETLAPT